MRARHADNGNGLCMHWLEAGDASPETPMIVLLHGFPDLAFSWRHQLLALAQAGFHVVAPDQRGYGRTTGWTADASSNLRAFRMDNLARDILGLVHVLGKTSVHAVVGHDFGSHVAAWCALIRPDVFRSLAMLATPFTGPPGDAGTPVPRARQLAEAIAGLSSLERPRKHYQLYYSGPDANVEMHGARQGLREFLRGYYHLKSAEGAEERPMPLPDLSASSLARLPTYYVMDVGLGMADTVAQGIAQREMGPSRWLSEDSLGVYSEEFGRTGFQGGLLWYRAATSPALQKGLEFYAGSTVDVPSCFIAGELDWGVHMLPGALAAMQRDACTRWVSARFIADAGHWVQQEQPEAVNAALLDFIATSR
ncbi:alpha/beta hydrolase [Variovorax ginsengisoli]|uniref:Alpha/beta hydrolase n=1 Tax=Variovorax ginsengisoli TaxID=363844 RepID=A0ABT8SCG3_9BURK|nr:alpha/beta hydrolase [Variovorax ginsengisoli]MDN8617421.1 alpha/beta hydrolase [Variovorax ginsengisoli]MDO1536591.1 alpha/beta hydrolase [Variovorax ginsengisoli]